MEFWEFLLQKEGDRSWLPLESSKVEILEGRYRVVARSSSVNTSVEIRIVHNATMETPLVRRTQKRTGKTNRDGLIVIIPFTKLLPGVWELRCTSDLMSEMMGEGWQRNVQLEVEPQAVEADWEPGWDENVTAAEAVEIGASSPPFQTTGTTETTGTTDTAEISLSNAPNESAPIVPAAVSPAPGASPVAADVESAPVQNNDDAPANSISAAASAFDLLPLTPRTVDAPTDVTDVTDTTGAADATDATGAVVRNSPLFQQAEQLSESVVEAAFDELGVELNPTAPPPATRSASLPSQSTSLPVTRLHLGQSTYVVQRGQPLILVGQAEHAAGLLTDEIAVSELQIRLYDPRNSQVLVNQRQPLTPKRLPFAFSCQIALPDTYQTYLLLGEVVLYAAEADSPIELSTQTFTVTTDLHELLESIANDFTEPDLPPPPSAPVYAEPVSPNVAFLNLPGVSQVNLQFRPSVPQPLPPQLRPVEANNGEQPRKVPELPTFAKTTTLQQAAEVSPAEGTVVDVLSALDEFSVDAIPDLEVTEAARQPGSPGGIPLEETLIPASSSGVPFNLVPEAPQAFDDTDPISDWYKDEFLGEPARQQVPEAPRSPSPEDRAFQALNLQERFWARLQSLMTDEELSASLKTTELDEAMARSATPGELAGNSTGAGRRSRFSGGLDAALAAQEVVAEDALVPHKPTTSAGNTATPEAPSQVFVLPLDQSIPVPQLELVTKELIAGQAFNTAVRLPNLTAQLMVKLWLRDRQSRTLLSGPHWLMDFTPDGFGNQITRIELDVPRGCLEVQLEAITVEMPTQRESDKATLIREVVPPDLSSFSLEDFDI